MGRSIASTREALALWDREESGQDLIEYALSAAVIDLAATFGMKSVATALSDAFNAIAAELKGYTG